MALRRFLFVNAQTGAPYGAWQESSQDSDEVQLAKVTIVTGVGGVGLDLGNTDLVNGDLISAKTFTSTTTASTGTVLDLNTNDAVNIRKATFVTGSGGIAIDAGGLRITNLNTTPSANSDAASKAYVDSMAQGIDWHPSVRVVATSAVTIATPGATIDGVTMAANDRVLLTAQNGTTADVNNGIWVWNAAGSALTRPTDYNATPVTPLTASVAVFVEEGTNGADTGWVLTTNNTAGSITVGTTATNWTQFTGLGRVTTTGNGITITGNALSLDADLDAFSILGSGPGYLYKSAAATYQLDATIPITRGGTGQTSFAAGQLLYGSGANATTLLTGNSSGTKQFLSMTSNTPSWGVLASGDIPNNSAQAGSVAQSVTFQNTGGDASSTTYNGSVARTIGPTTIGAVKLAGDTMTGRLVHSAGNGTTAGGVQLTSGTVKTTPVVGDNGSIEWDGTNLYVINSAAARKTVAYTDSALSATNAPELSFTTTATAATGGLLVGDVVYHDGTNIAKADATNTANAYRASRVLGVAKAAATAGNPATIIAAGIYTTTGLTAGETYFLNTAGTITNNTNTLASRSRTIQIGYAISTTQLLVDIRDLGMKA